MAKKDIFANSFHAKTMHASPNLHQHFTLALFYYALMIYKKEKKN